MSLIDELSATINRACAENGSNTPDFLLATFLSDCLAAFDKAVSARDRWYGVALAPGQSDPQPPHEDREREATERDEHLDAYP